MTKFIIIPALIFVFLISCNQKQIDGAHPVSSIIPVSETQLIEQTLNPNWVYINRDIQWEAPPKQIEQTFKGSLNSTIVVFYPSGKFASVGCTLYRNNTTKAITISAGDDYSVSKGTWKQNSDGSITTTSRVTYGMARNSPEEVGKWIIRKQSTDKIASEFEHDEQIYIPTQKIGGFDQLAPMIKDED